MSKNNNQLTRRKPSKTFRKRILIVTEDTKSCNYYFDQIRIDHKLPEANVQIIPGNGSDPVSVIKTAHEQLISTGPYDRVFVVIDRDKHNNYNEAITLLKQYNNNSTIGTRKFRKWTPPENHKDRERFELVLSNPCFEFWLLLHFIDWTKPFVETGTSSVCSLVCHELRHHGRLPDYEKCTNYWNELKHLYDCTAKPNSIKTINTHGLGHNPSTNIYIVVDAIKCIKF